MCRQISMFVSAMLFVLSFSMRVSASAQEKPVLNILFVGKSGAGKSTLINVFYNHIKSKSYEDEREIVIPLLHARTQQLLVNVDQFKAYNIKLNAAGRSQTSEVHCYPVENKHYVVNLWDAPGVLDNAGAEADRLNVEKIANALKGLSINALVVVLGASDVSRDGVELAASINNLSRMLPKSFQNNVLGVFNRAIGFQRSERMALSTWFKSLFQLSRPEQEVAAFMDGSSFFDSMIEKDEDELTIGRMRWKADAAAVAKVVEFAAKSAPASGADAMRVQETTKGIELKMKSLAQKLMSLQALAIDIQLNENNLRNNVERRDANKDFEKTRQVDVTVQDVEWHGWWIFGGPARVERVRSETLKYIDEAQRAEYQRALSHIQNDSERIEFCRREIARIEEQKKEAVKEIKIAQKELEDLAITTSLDPYIKYLEERLRNIREDAKLTKEERDDQANLYRVWIKEYQDIRVGVSQL